MLLWRSTYIVMCADTPTTIGIIAAKKLQDQKLLNEKVHISLGEGVDCLHLS